MALQKRSRRVTRSSIPLMYKMKSRILMGLSTKDQSFNPDDLKVRRHAPIQKISILNRSWGVGGWRRFLLPECFLASGTSSGLHQNALSDLQKIRLRRDLPETTWTRLWLRWCSFSFHLAGRGCCVQASSCGFRSSAPLLGPGDYAGTRKWNRLGQLRAAAFAGRAEAQAESSG